MVRGRTPVLPGKAVASSMIAPALLAWWLWPVNRAVRVGLQSAVVWKRLYLRPLAAIFSSVGMRIGPPNALLCPKPMSSISTMTTLGAPGGAFTSKRAGAFALRASSSVIGFVVGSAIGSTVRSSVAPFVWASTGAAHHDINTATDNCRKNVCLMISLSRWQSAVPHASFPRREDSFPAALHVHDGPPFGVRLVQCFVKLADVRLATVGALAPGVGNTGAARPTACRRCRRWRCVRQAARSPCVD